ncbi:MAG: DUF3307 domain-containing protein [Methylophagaceae bacterium]
MTFIFFLLLLKHAIADLGLQGYIGGQGKRFYFDRKLWLHSTHHGIGTFLVLVFFTDVQTALLLGLLDIFLHWQIDYTKTQAVRKLGYNNTMRQFWWLQGIDQAAHYSCYFLFIFLLG